MSLLNRYPQYLLCALLLLVSSGARSQFGPDATANADTLDAIVAVVGNDIVTRRELDQAARAVRRQLERARGKGNLPPAAIIERQVLERLIMEQLQLRAAEERGITVGDTALNAAVGAIAKRNKMSLDALRRAVEKDGSDFARYREQIRRDMMSTRLRQREVDSRVRVSEQEIDNVIEISTAGSEYRIAQIMIAVASDAPPKTVDAARAKAQTLLGQLRQGAEFARLAASFSNGREALEGGELGWRSRSQLPSLFAETVVRLQPGEVSSPVRSPSGFHLIKLLEVRKAQVSADNDQARQALREQLSRRKSDERWDQWLRQMRDESYVEIRL